MPAASHVEKDGHFTNTQRLLQWHDKALEPPGDARSELWFMHHLFKRVQRALRGLAGRPRLADRQPHLGLPRARRDPRARRRGGAEGDQRLRRRLAASRSPASASSRTDGSTASGCWIYAGCYKDGVNQTRRRDPGDLDAEGGWVSPEWAWAWPANRRILYNRASADPQGRPWSERKKLRLVGRGARASGRATTCPTSRPTRQPAYKPEPDAKGMGAIGGTDPFMMMADGKGWLYSPAGLMDGPMPTHYEPLRVADAEPALPRARRATRRR